MGEPAKIIDINQNKKPSFGDMLKKTAVTEPAKKKKKKEMPVLSPPEEIKQAVDEYVEASLQNKKSKGTMDLKGAMIIGWVDEQQDKNGFDNNFRTSYNVQGIKESIKFISSNRYSMSSEDIGQLQEILGPAYAELIIENHSVKLRDEVFESEELQGELMELIGDRFGDFFETTISLSVSEGFNEKVYQHVHQDTLPMLKTFCKRYKPSLR